MNNQNFGHTLGEFVDDLLHANAGRFFKDDRYRDEWIKKHNHLPVNIIENEDEYKMEVVAPGIRKENIRLEVRDNVLEVAYEHPADESADEVRYIKRGFTPQSFKRSFRLGAKVNADSISARYESGILHLLLPKKEAMKSVNKTIEIA